MMLDRYQYDYTPQIYLVTGIFMCRKCLKKVSSFFYSLNFVWFPFINCARFLCERKEGPNTFLFLIIIIRMLILDYGLIKINNGKHLRGFNIFSHYFIKKE